MKETVWTEDVVDPEDDRQVVDKLKLLEFWLKCFKINFELNVE